MKRVKVFLYYTYQGSTCAVTLTCCMEDAKQSNIRTVVEEKALFITIPYRYMDIWMGKYKCWRDFILTTYSIRFEELLKVNFILSNW